MFMNLSKFQKLAPQDQKIVIDAAQEICAKRFEEVKAADTARLKQLSDAGVKVLELTPEQLQAFADVARKEVWPKLTDEVGAKILKQLQAATGAM
jgi:TRAP-type C4-dicarboxylate transport system substrate-binding protein